MLPMTRFSKLAVIAIDEVFKVLKKTIRRLSSLIGIFEYLSPSKENNRGRADHGSWVS
jgi:hypothetical protein